MPLFNFIYLTFKLSLSLLQAMIRGELDVLKDWCYEAVSYMLLSAHLLIYLLNSHK